MTTEGLRHIETDEDWQRLYDELYVGAGMSTYEIERACDATVSRITYNFNRLGLPLRQKQGGPKPKATVKPKAVSGPVLARGAVMSPARRMGKRRRAS